MLISKDSLLTMNVFCGKSKLLWIDCSRQSSVSVFKLFFALSLDRILIYCKSLWMKVLEK